MVENVNRLVLSLSLFFSFMFAKNRLATEKVQYIVIT